MWNIFNKRKEYLEKTDNSKQYVRIILKDDEFTAMHLDDDENILAFISLNPKNIEMSDFYYSLMKNTQLVNIMYNDKEYNTVITEIKLIDNETLRIYYTVLNPYTNITSIDVRAKDGSEFHTINIKE